MNWREFWNGTHSIYVNERHRALHYDRIAKDIAALVPTPDACVLDYGCGEAETAELVARRCAMLYLYDAAPNVQARLRVRFGRNERIVVLSTEALDAMTDHSLDVIVANSVIQYLTHQEFEALLDLSRRKLKPTGMLVVADVIPESATFVDDTRALLTFASQGGFLLPALTGLAATAFSEYRKLRQEIGLTRYAEEDIETLFSAHGYRAERSATNIGHNQSRMMFVARPL
ncbi:MAG: methyltransferase [Hyphomicrobiales bacterium]|nr:methyltransferase [Hyphomicrobiales bacterium]